MCGQKIGARAWWSDSSSLSAITTLMSSTEASCRSAAAPPDGTGIDAPDGGDQRAAERERHEGVVRRGVLRLHVHHVVEVPAPDEVFGEHRVHLAIGVEGDVRARSVRAINLGRPLRHEGRHHVRRLEDER